LQGIKLEEDIRSFRAVCIEDIEKESSLSAKEKRKRIKEVDELIVQARNRMF
jgi:hypothetical protein